MTAFLNPPRVDDEPPGFCYVLGRSVGVYSGPAAVVEGPAKEVGERISINKKSSYLFVAVLISLILSLIFKGDITLSAVTPIIFLALFQRFLVHQHNQQKSYSTI